MNLLIGVLNFCYTSPYSSQSDKDILFAFCNYIKKSEQIESFKILFEKISNDQF